MSLSICLGLRGVWCTCLGDLIIGCDLHAMILVTYEPLEDILFASIGIFLVDRYSWGNDQFIPSRGHEAHGWMMKPQAWDMTWVIDLHIEERSRCLGGTLAYPRRMRRTFTHLDNGLGRLKDHPTSPWCHPKGARDFCSGVPVKEDIFHNVW